MATMGSAQRGGGKGGIFLGLIVGLVLGALLLAPRTRAPLVAQLSASGTIGAAGAGVSGYGCGLVAAGCRLLRSHLRCCARPLTLFLCMAFLWCRRVQEDPAGIGGQGERHSSQQGCGAAQRAAVPYGRGRACICAASGPPAMRAPRNVAILPPDPLRCSSRRRRTRCRRSWMGSRGRKIR